MAPLPKYRFVSSLEEGHHKAIFCVAFNLTDANHRDLFATVGGDRASVYRCQADGTFQVLQVFVDEDPTEEFYCCKWGVDEVTGAALLFLAGNNGVVRVVDCSTHSLLCSFAGHGNSINDISIHPTKPDLFLTASKDESMRLWNARTRTCVLVVAGEGGHKNEVLSLDWHPWKADRFLSSGMDSMVKVWSTNEHAAVVEHSLTWPLDSPTSFPTKFLQYPAFSSEQVHGGYVDCVRWLGDLCLSKSMDQTILLWRPEEASDASASTTSARFTVLQEFSLPDSFIWFVRFSLDFNLSLLACGNKSGKVYVWNPHQCPPVAMKLSAPQCTSVVRQTAVSWNGDIILAGCEDGSVWRWDRLGSEAATAADVAAVAAAAGGPSRNVSVSPSSTGGDEAEGEEREAAPPVEEKVERKVGDAKKK